MRFVFGHWLFLAMHDVLTFVGLDRFAEDCEGFIDGLACCVGAFDLCGMETETQAS